MPRPRDSRPLLTIVQARKLAELMWDGAVLFSLYKSTDKGPQSCTYARINDNWFSIATGDDDAEWVRETFNEESV